MSTIVSIKIKNFDEIRTAWKKAPQKMTQEIHRAVGLTIQKVQAESMREAPVNKRTGGGNLRQSIHSQMLGVASGMVEVGAEYGIYVHEGTRPHQIRSRGRVLADTRTNQFFGRTVNHPGTIANPFMQRGVDNASGDIEQYFISILDNLFK